MVPNVDLALIAEERLVSDQSSAELAPLLTVDQRALVSLFATAALHRLEAAPLLRAYALETTSLAIEGVADRIEDGMHPLDAAIADRALPQAVQVALSSSRASGTLGAFYKSWLSQTLDNRADWVPHEQTNAAKLGRALLRTLICIWMLTVLLMYVIPEQQKVHEEFELEWNMSFHLFLVVSDAVARWIMPVIMGALFLGLLYVLIFKRSIANNYVRRWLPSRWQQIVLPKKIMTRKLLAWDLLAFRANQETKVDWEALVAQKSVSALEAEIVQGATSRETQAWLLRSMAQRKHLRQRRSVSWRIDGFILLLQLFIAGMTILAAFALFSTLIGLIKGLT